MKLSNQLKHVILFCAGSFCEEKDGSLRMCVDYRVLKAIRKKVRYPIPIAKELLDALRSIIFSSIDLRSGHCQIAMSPEQIEKKAFGPHFGQYNFVVMPFGLCDAPAIFMQAINGVFKGLDFVKVYMDDVLNHSKSKEKYIARLKEVFERLGKYTANLGKYHSAKAEIDFLGNTISKDGIQPLADKVDVIKNWVRSTNAKTLRTLLGLVGSYRKFIQGFAEITT